MKTNRELYLNIGDLVKQKRQQGVPIVQLKEYLAGMIQLARPFAHRAELSLDEFFGILETAFDGAAQLHTQPVQGDHPPFQQWVSEVTKQIEDLRAMAQSGQLNDKHRYFGIDAPSGARWYNFDPCTYIECGVSGAFGGWEEGDDTGRMYVPGQVSCLDTEGHLVARDPKDLREPILELPGITWEMFSIFVWCGQNYE